MLSALLVLSLGFHPCSDGLSVPVKITTVVAHRAMMSEVVCFCILKARSRFCVCAKRGWRPVVSSATIDLDSGSLTF
jgi:hypothetical protein